MAGNKDVQKLLADLRNNPVDNAGATDQVLAQIYSFLMSVTKDQDGRLHWFCNRANPTVVGAASFLLRLFAYDGSEAEAWRNKLNSCVSKCCECLVELETVKKTSRTTYFAKYSREILDNFWISFETWEVSKVLEGLNQLKLTPENTNPMHDTLSDLPPPLVLRMMSNWAIFSNEKVQAIIQMIPPRTVFEEWPATVVPPGVFALLIQQTSVVRQWASSQAAHYKLVPLPADAITDGHLKAFNTLALYLTSTDGLSSKQLSKDLAFFSPALEPYDLWTGFGTALRFIPIEFLKSSQRFPVDFRKIVFNRLGDNDICFTEILRCFIFLLKRLGDSIWPDEPSDRPEEIINLIKGNPAFISLVQSAKSSGERPWFLSWFYEYLHTLQKMNSIYGSVIAKLSNFLLKEIELEKFGDTRSILVDLTARLLSSAFSKAQTQDDKIIKKAVLSVIDTHDALLAQVALHRDFDRPEWASPRTALRQLLDKILLADVQAISLVITETCRVTGRAVVKKSLGTIPTLSIRKGLWPKVYKSLHRRDPEGIATILCVVTKSSHIDTLNKKTFDEILSATNLGEEYPNGATVIDTINAALQTIRSGFLETIKELVDYSTSTQVLDILQRPGVGKAAMLLILSPVDDFHAAAKTLVGQAFDVDGRLECIRALLERLPDQALQGLLDFLEIFVTYSPSVPEACSWSKSLVRCFTDVIEVLCAKPDGLLRNERYLRTKDIDGPASRMIQLWTLMSKAIAVIFKRTPAWSTYFDNAVMIEWMRDALIFGRDMLAQWQVIENAASAFHNQQNQGKAVGAKKSLSSIGQRMINCFQDVLTELSRWLRLTDEELLHQSFALLTSLLDFFRKTDTRPCEAAFTKLTKHAETARKDVKQIRSRLDTSRITTLEEALATFNEDDDEVQIISEKFISQSIKPQLVKTEKKRLEKSVDRKPSGSILPKNEKVVLNQSKSTSAKYFNEKDKQKFIESAPPLPSSRRLDKTATASTSQITRPKLGTFKNEATSPSTESSSESGGSDSDEVEPKGGLASLGIKFHKSPKIKKPAQRRQIKYLAPNMGQTVASIRIDHREELRRAQMRMKPDISDLHRTLLSWNYNHEGPLPPGFHNELSMVPDIFMDYTHFHRIFEPLLLMECWAQIVQAKLEDQETYECKISSKQYADDWLEVDITFEGTLRKDYYLAETDIVLLSQREGKKCILAKTRSFNVTFNSTQASLRCYMKPGVNEDPGLMISSTWLISKVFSLSTLHREYAALKALPYYDFVNTVLRPRLQLTTPPAKAEIQAIMAQYKINEPQATAILMAMNTDGFSLIQGPPGTGKTSTICGLVSLFLSKRQRPPVPIQVGNKPPPPRVPMPKVLLCAPSNAAIDEIARRIKDGYKGPEMRGEPVKVVRIGTEQSMNISVKDISLDSLVDQSIDPTRDKNAGSALGQLRKELEEVKRKRVALIQAQNDTPDVTLNPSFNAEFGKLNARRNELTQQIDRLKDEQKSASRTLDALRRSTRQKILQEADVICATLSGAGHDSIEQLEFDMIIIDEAAQAIELSTLIPLKYRTQRCVLVGDPQQLPPTVLSQEACKFRYNQSLFVRMQKSQPDAVHLLSIQYRMHPDISVLPSRVFYQGRLQDGPGMKEKTAQPWHANPQFGTYKFFNVHRGLEETTARHSVKNRAECDMAISLYKRLRLSCKVNLDYRIGVVSMYRAQISELKRAFEKEFGRDILGKVDFNTVDGFQGQEKDIILLSCVRAGPGVQSVGFLADIRRMNVALTRAKSSLYILGNAATLERSDTNWREIVNDARNRSCLIDVDNTFFTKPFVGPIQSSNQLLSKQETYPVQTTPTSVQPSVAPEIPPTTLQSANISSDLPSIPTDLFQPREFKQSQHINQDKRPSNTVNGTNPPVPVNGLPQKPRGTKRPAEDASSTTNADNRRPPPLKRPKKKEASLFIPKQKKP